MHPPLLRAAGFRGYTVPALEIDGRRVQTSLAIARELERIKPDPPLYPADDAERARVEEAERWGEAELQSLPRRLFRWALTEQLDARIWLAEVAKLPASALQARISVPVTRAFARASGASAERVRDDLAALPGKLDRADELVRDGVISAERPNAATFQIATSIRALGLFAQLDPVVAGHASAELARALVPDWPRSPARLPDEWLPSGARAH